MISCRFPPSPRPVPRTVVSPTNIAEYVYDDESEALVPMTADMLTFDPDEVKAVQEGRRAIITVTVTYQGKTRQLRVRLSLIHI